MNLPRLSELPNWADFDRVALDTETRDDHLKKLGPGVRRGGYITGLSFCCGDENGPAFYLPMRHEGGGNYDDPQRVLEYVRHQAKHFRGEIVGTNLQYDLDYLAEESVLFTPLFFRDIQVSGPLLDEPTMVRIQDKETGKWFWGEEFHRMSLNAQAERLGIPGKDEAKLEAWAAERGLDPKADMWKAPAAVVAPYAVQDVRLPLQIDGRHWRQIDAQGLQQIYDLESRLLPVLVKMRRRGVLVDLDKLERIEAKAWQRENEACAQVTRISGRAMSPDDTAKSTALALILEATGVKVPLTEAKISQKTGKPTGGNPSVTSPWLRTLGTPLAGAILDAKHWNKIRTTFCESIKAHHINGRVHCTFNQLKQQQDDGETRGAEFGRLSSSAPNLQQQPNNEEWRSIYLPDDGGEWACLDFSSQEPRMITHYAEVVALDPKVKMDPAVRTAALAAAHACRTDPNWDNHGMMAGFIFGDDYSADDYRHGCKTAKALRSQAKIMFLGRCLGKGTRLLTDGGEKPIESITRWDRLWDGIDFVPHDGVVSSGMRKCIEVNGVWITPEHEVMTPNGWFQAQDLNTNNLPLESFTENSPSRPSPWAQEVGSSPFTAIARVVDQLLFSETIWSPDIRHAVLCVVTARLVRQIHNTAMCQTRIVRDFLAELVRSLAAALRNHTCDMDCVESGCTSPGLLIVECFSDTWSRFQDGMTHLLTSTGSTTMGTTSPAISDSLPIRRTCETETYDIRNVGSNNRFGLANGMIMSNCYGMGGGKLCRSLGLPTVWVVRNPNVSGWEVVPADSAEGRAFKAKDQRPFEMAGPEGVEILAKFDRGVPYIDALQKMVQNKVKQEGHLTTILGRRVRFATNPETGKPHDLHKALNLLIQPSSADQTKMAMVIADDAGICMQLQVHDELNLTVYGRKEAEELEHIMVHAVELNVPTICDVEIGPSWGEIR